MDKNTTFAFILIGAILILWMYLNAPSPDQYKKNIKGTDTTQVVADSSKIIKEAEKKVEKKAIPLAETAPTDFGKYFSADTIKKNERTITIENDLAIIELSTKGGNFVRYYLKKFNNWYSAGEEEKNPYKYGVQLINYEDGGSYDLAFVTADGKAINTGDLFFTTDARKLKYKLSGEDSVTISFKLSAGTGKYINKIFTFYGNKYSINSSVEMVGMNNLISNNAYDLVWGNGIRFTERNSVDEANYSDASVYYGGEQVVVDAKDDDKATKEDFNGRIDWLGVRNKYFAAIIAPKNPSGVDGAYISGTKKTVNKVGIKEFYNAHLIIPFKNQALEKTSFLLYIGPVDYDILSTYGHNLEAIVDFGSFFGLKFIVRPIAEYILLPLFNFLHTFIPNYGFVIIVFSLIIKFVLYPLTKQSYQSMKKMQMLQPKINEMKEKYKDDQQKQQKETMKLYSTYGVNPAGGCLPLLLQMPIFVALWGLFKIAIELRQQPFMLWIKDLSAPDEILDLGFKLPLFGIQHISGLALLMGVTTFVQQKMSTKDPKQQALVYVMPVMLTLMFMSFPSGLNLYYFMFNVFSIAQQYYINHKHDGMELVPVKNPNKKKGFMQKLMETAEQNTKAQQQRKRK
jgi:YidC/Oxa1 family membrane protein insertase